MKSIFLMSLIFSFIFFIGCDDKEDPAGDRNVGVVSTISDVNPAIYISGELDESYVRFVADIEEGTSFEDAYIVGSFNGVSQRTKIVNISSFPAEIILSAEDVAQALGLALNDIKSEDYFVFEVITVSDGLTTRSNGGLTVRVVCPFDPSLTFGSFTASSAGWGANGGITIEADEEDPYTVYVYGLAELDGLTGDVGPLVMHINPLSFAVTADKSVLASVAFSYTNIAYAGSGVFNSCTGTYEMLFAITVDQGSFGSYAFTLSKN